MKDRLPFEDFVPYAPDVPGEQVHVHHCRSGKHNDRLYIRRNEDGTVVGFCHHCGCSGFYNDSYRNPPRRVDARIRRVCEDRRQIHLPSDFTTNTKEWSAPARAWVRRYGITDDELDRNSVGYSKRYGSVILPVFGEEGVLVSYQRRPVDRQVTRTSPGSENREGGRTPPKYVSCRQPGRSGGVDIFRAIPNRGARVDNPEHGVTIVVTEDALSAIKVSRVEGMWGVAVMGSSLKEPQAVKISREAADVIIFFDNDNEQVRANQKKAARLLEPLVKGNVKIIEAEKDPKCYTTSELRELLK